MRKWQGEPGSFPRIVRAQDYHDFQPMADVLSEYNQTSVLVRELGMHDGRYVGALVDAGMAEILDHIEDDFRNNLNQYSPSL